MSTFNDDDGNQKNSRTPLLKPTFAFLIVTLYHYLYHIRSRFHSREKKDIYFQTPRGTMASLRGAFDDIRRRRAHPRSNDVDVVDVCILDAMRDGCARRVWEWWRRATQRKTVACLSLASTRTRPMRARDDVEG